MSASGYSKSVVAADTWQTVEVYMHVNHTGAITFLSDADNKIYREHGDKLTLYYEKPVYTVSFNIHLDDDEIYDDDLIEEVVKECMENTGANISDFKVLDIND